MLCVFDVPVCASSPPSSPQVHDNSSYHRQATADALPIAHDSPSIRRILGDTSDPLCVDFRAWPLVLVCMSFHVSDAGLILALTLHNFLLYQKRSALKHVLLCKHTMLIAADSQSFAAAPRPTSTRTRSVRPSFDTRWTRSPTTRSNSTARKIRATRRRAPSSRSDASALPFWTLTD